MDKYRIDSHKMMYHVQRVHAWLEGQTVYPIYMEVSPAGACNHRCTYCGLDFMQYRARFLETVLLKERIAEFSRLGVKSIMYAGEGEPFLHKDIGDIICHTRRSGIDAAVTTNGVLLRRDLADQILGEVQWIKVSINGASKEIYAKIHRCRPEDYDAVMANLEYAVKARAAHGYKCVLGLQILLLPDNAHEVVPLARLAKDMGLDYLVVKPYSQHPKSVTRKYCEVSYKEYDFLGKELESFNSESFSVIFRIQAMKKWDEKKREYPRCLALPFWSYIDAEGNVWGCSMYLGEDRFFYGNIYQQTFQEIWEGERRRESLREVENHLDVSACRVNCRMDEVNKYLWSLKVPPAHVNFI